MSTRPAFYMASFVVIFGAIFVYAILESPYGVGVNFRPSPELFGSLLITLSVFMIEYSRVTSTMGGLSHTHAIALEIGFLSTMLGIVLSLLGLSGVLMLALLLASLFSMIIVLYFITDLIWFRAQK